MSDFIDLLTLEAEYFLLSGLIHFIFYTLFTVPLKKAHYCAETSGSVLFYF